MASSKDKKASPASPISFKKSDFITINVGKDPDKQMFAAHKGILCGTSEFFRRALNGTWEEAKTGVVNLPEDNPEAFSLWLNFAYTGKVLLKEFQKNSDTDQIRSDLDSEYLSMFMLFAISEKLLDVSAKDAVITAIFKLANIKSAEGTWFFPVGRCINIAYDSTPEGSNLRRLVVDFWSSIRQKIPENVFDELPNQFLADLVNKIIEERRVSNKTCTAKVNGVVAYLQKEVEDQKGN